MAAADERANGVETADRSTSSLDVAQLYRDGHDPQVRLTAQALIELLAGVLETDAASLWWYDDDAAYLVARFPEDRAPAVKRFADMPEVGISIRAGECRVYERSQQTGATRAWMERAGVAVSLRVPVQAAEVPRHFIGLSWASEDHPPIDQIVATARRFADHIALSLVRIVGHRVRVESALELSDNVAQALTVAQTSLAVGDTETAEQAVAQAFDHTQRIMGRLLRDDPASNLNRLYPSTVQATDPSDESGSRAQDGPPSR